PLGTVLPLWKDLPAMGLGRSAPRRYTGTCVLNDTCAGIPPARNQLALKSVGLKYDSPRMGSRQSAPSGGMPTGGEHSGYRHEPSRFCLDDERSLLDLDYRQCGRRQGEYALG